MLIEHPIVAILGGTGKEGTGLALRWAAAGYTIVIGSRVLERAALTADRINQQLGMSSVSGMTNIDAAAQADICVLTVVYSAHQEAIKSVKDALAGKILVDATSRVDFMNPRPPEPPCAAEKAQEFLGSSVKVVAAFQNVPAKSLRKDFHQPITADVLVCSDDVSAAQQVIGLAKAAGMQGYYAGPLVNANVVEGITSILISLNRFYEVKDTSIKILGVSEARSIRS